MESDLTHWYRAYRGNVEGKNLNSVTSIYALTSHFIPFVLQLKACQASKGINSYLFIYFDNWEITKYMATKLIYNCSLIHYMATKLIYNCSLIH